MHYLWIKEDDSKAFKSFLSGNEIEVGLYVNPTAAVSPGNEIEIFYGEDTSDTYRAQVKRKQFLPTSSQAGKTFLTMSLIKI
jgi:hypothetical protein